MIITKMTFAVLICLIFVFSLSIIYFSKKRIDNVENRIYQFLIVGNMLGLLLHLLCDVVSYDYETLPLFFSTFILKTLLVYYFIFGILLLLYLVAIVHAKKKNYYSIIIIIVSIISIIFIYLLPQSVVLLKEKMIFYTNGLDTKFVFMMSAFEVVLMYLIIALNFKKIDKKKILPLIIFSVLAVFSTIIQKRFPDIVFTDCMETIIILLMYFTIENPDVKMIEQLELAKEHAEKANRSKTEFLSSMSHEVRTPLNAIVGFSDCIMESNTLDEAKENAKDIVNASQTLLEIVNGILDISKIEAGKIEIVNSKYNPTEVFTELAKLISPRMKEKGLDFTYYIAPDIPTTLNGDHANIRKIVTNLLSNACKYTEKGFVRYEVNCVNMNGYSRLIISVEDSGRGIKKEQIDKLFTKFQRLEEDRNTTIEGTGLGLAITKQLTELMGGKIIVHTIYGEGSKFTAIINQKIDVADGAVVRKVKDTLDLTDVRILLVDDAPLNLKVACKLLEKYNANKVDTCASGFECIDLIQSGRQYDLVLLDDMMPKMSGVQTLKQLKEKFHFKTPVVALTANAISGMRDKYLSDGFDDYLAKPIDKDELVRVINQVLGRVVTEELKPVVVDNTHKDEKEKEVKIIPVDDNIEQILGKRLDLSEREIVNGVPAQVEYLEEEPLTSYVFEKEKKTETETTPELLPVVDIEPIPSVEAYDRTYLEENGVDVNHGLELLGDMEMYNSTMSDFVSEVDDKWNRMIDSLAKQDMESYSIDVHSLKSDCKYLGFMKLADIAYQHELKSKENDSKYIRDHYKELEDEYYKVLDIVHNYCSYNKL